MRRIRLPIALSVFLLAPLQGVGGELLSINATCAGKTECVFDGNDNLEDMPARAPFSASQREYVGYLFRSMLGVIEQTRSVGENDGAFGKGEFFWPKDPSKPVKSRISFGVANFKFRSISIGFSRKNSASAWDVAGLNIHPRNFPFGFFDMKLPKSFFDHFVLENSRTENRINESLDVVNVFRFKKEENGHTIKLLVEASPSVSDIQDGYPRSFHNLAIYLDPK